MDHYCSFFPYKKKCMCKPVPHALLVGKDFKKPKQQHLDTALIAENQCTLQKKKNDISTSSAQPQSWICLKKTELQFDIRAKIK